MIIFTDDKKNLGASDLVDKILPNFAQLSYDPIAIDLPQFGHAPPISLENSAEIKAPIAFIKQILIHLNIKSASSTVVFTGEAGHYMIPFIQDQPHFFQAILGIDPKHEIISSLDLNKKSLFQKRISSILAPFWVFWTPETTQIDLEKELFAGIATGGNFMIDFDEKVLEKPIGARHSWIFEDQDQFLRIFKEFDDFVEETNSDQRSYLKSLEDLPGQVVIQNATAEELKV